jgi:hypothetical protein
MSSLRTMSGTSPSLRPQSITRPTTPITVASHPGVLDREFMPVFAVGLRRLRRLRQNPRGSTSALHLQSTTRSAIPRVASIAHLHQGVLRRELMPMFAVGLRCLRVSSKPHVVEDVRSSRVPPQVLHPVVGLDPVVMAALHTGRARADEGFKDKSVYGTGSATYPDFVIAAAVDATRDDSVGKRNPRRTDSANTSDLSCVGHLVTSNIRYVCPRHGSNRTNRTGT